MPIILAAGRLKKENHEFKANMKYINENLSQNNTPTKILMLTPNP
jgi:hypothetical protein